MSCAKHIVGRSGERCLICEDDKKPGSELDHPCKQTCSGWIQGYQKGFTDGDRMRMEMVMAELKRQAEEYRKKDEKSCTTCNGMGTTFPRQERCSQCNGRGSFVRDSNQKINCRECESTGYFLGQICRACSGLGYSYQ